MSKVSVIPVEGLPEFGEGMAIGAEIAAGAAISDGDVVVVSQKIVSKAEGRVRRLAEVEPSERANRLAAILGKEPALVELILAESRHVLRAERSVLIVETHHGFVCANAGIDSSNLPEPGAVALLPEDPDASARRIRASRSASSPRSWRSRTSTCLQARLSAKVETSRCARRVNFAIRTRSKASFSVRPAAPPCA